jgi:hypothetical protein
MDAGTGEPFEQITIGDPEMLRKKCDECKQIAEIPSLMQFDFITYMGHLECMKELRKRLESGETK